MIPISLAVIPHDNPDVVDNEYPNIITISIVDNKYDTDVRVNHVQFSILTNRVDEMKGGIDMVNEKMLFGYAGWNKALRSMDMDNPPQFKFVEKNGDIRILLLDSPSPHGLSGMAQGNMIVVYNITDLYRDQIHDLIRHEIGHILGLGHSSDPQDLMNPNIPTFTNYISERHLDLLEIKYGK